MKGTFVPSGKVLRGWPVALKYTRSLRFEVETIIKRHLAFLEVAAAEKDFRSAYDIQDELIGR